MPCILALVIFGILGIFSASHRALAKEAFACVFKRITFRPCNTGFQEKIKGKVLARLINRSVFWTRVVNKNYELLSWIFFVLMMGSFGWVLVGGYNFYVYGSCNGLNESGFCAFDPSGENNKVSELNGLFCGISSEDQQVLTLKNVNISDFPAKNIGATKNFFFIGCYACDYTRKSYPVIKKLLEKKEVNYTFAHYPTHNDQSLLGEVSYCVYQNYGDRFWSFNDYLFTEEKDFVLDKNNLPLILANFDFDFEKINICAHSPETKEAIQNQIGELNKTGIYGTPTIFINEKAFVGPKPLRVYKSAINRFILF
jgi:glutaredoxin